MQTLMGKWRNWFDAFDNILKGILGVASQFKIPAMVRINKYDIKKKIEIVPRISVKIMNWSLQENYPTRKFLLRP